ncbi:hypothetical protein BDA96_02G380100 [Sorghum bicolor]|uniref:Uncharacterized protein n=1 Tax=Sorghum bicolor TaxID=4558 RepID=A0A921UW46_SORBI|nr:hypothetical protein BDA96_02G380100 [Sorghum bicolor]
MRVAKICKASKRATWGRMEKIFSHNSLGASFANMLKWCDRKYRRETNLRENCDI